MYVAVKGGEAAIDAAHKLLARDRRGDLDVPEISAAQIREQLKLAVARVGQHRDHAPEPEAEPQSHVHHRCGA